MPLLIEPGTKADEMSLGDACEAMAAALLDAQPFDPLGRRIDLRRYVDRGGRRMRVRIKFTIEEVLT